MAQGITLSLAAGSLEFLQDGAWTKRLHPGWAASVGITAATFARHGYVGPRAAYEGRFGLYATHLGAHADEADLSLATAGLGVTWQIEDVSVKPMPACHFVHAAVDAAAALHGEIGDRAVARVTVLVPEGVVKTVCEPSANKQAPANSYDAQFSIPYVVATGLLRGGFTLDALEPAALADPAVRALAKRVDYAVDPGSTFPRHYTGEVVVELESGEVLRHREAVNRGNADRPLSNAEIEAKYFDNAMRDLERDTASRIRDAVLALDAAPASRLAAALCLEP
jgi:2-methylcitrate dehydratase PrpD